MLACKSTARPHARHGFTLIEMLVAIGILLLLMVITIAAVNITVSEDRVISAANSLQSFLEGARDRAIFSGRPTGVRFFKDPNDETLLMSCIYVDQVDPHEQGTATFDTTNQRLLHGTGTGWFRLKQKGMLADGAWLTAFDGTRFTVLTDTLTATAETLRLTRDCTPAQLGQAGSYQLQMQTAPLPNQEPRTFASQVAIDLDESQLPYLWGPFVSGPKYANTLEILFSPRGPVTGYTGTGVAHFTLAELEDVTLGNGVAKIDRKCPVRVVTVVMQTGKIHVSQVDQTDSNGDGFADDPFAYAAVGQ